MAIRDIPSVLNQYNALAQAREIRALQPQANALQSLIELYNLPETLQNQQQDQELNRQIQLATQQLRLQELQDRQNPNLALQRDIEKMMITRQINQPGAVITPLDPGLGSESLQTPGALTIDQQLALEAGGVQPVVRAAAPIQPVLSRGVPTGFGTQVIPTAKELTKLGAGESLIGFNRETGLPETVLTAPAKAPSERSLQFRDVGDAIVGFNATTGAEVSRTSKTANKKEASMKGFDTVSGLYGVFSPDEQGFFPKGVVPSESVPKPEKLKAVPATQVDKLAGLDLLSKKLEDIKLTPANVRASNVGWIDSATGYIQSLTGIPIKTPLAQNEAFRKII